MTRTPSTNTAGPDGVLTPAATTPRAATPSPQPTVEVDRRRHPDPTSSAATTANTLIGCPNPITAGRTEATVLKPVEPGPHSRDPSKELVVHAPGR